MSTTETVTVATDVDDIQVLTPEQAQHSFGNAVAALDPANPPSADAVVRLFALYQRANPFPTPPTIDDVDVFPYWDGYPTDVVIKRLRDYPPTWMANEVDWVTAAIAVLHARI